MEERRKDYNNLGEKLELFEKDFIDLKIEVKESLATIKSFMDNTGDYRESLHKKLDTFTELNEKTFNHIDKLTIRCIERTADYVAIQQHLDDHKNNKSFLRDKNFQLVIGITLLMFGLLIWVIQQRYLKKEQEIRESCYVSH